MWYLLAGGILDQYQDPAVYSDVYCLLLSACSFLWNMDNLVGSQLYRHILDLRQVFECFHMFIFFFYWLIKKDSAIEMMTLSPFNSTFWKKCHGCSAMTASYIEDKTASLLNPWKLWSVRLPSYLFRSGTKQTIW